MWTIRVFQSCCINSSGRSLGNGTPKLEQTHGHVFSNSFFSLYFKLLEVVDKLHPRQGFPILKLENPRFVQMSLLAAKQASMLNELQSSD